MTTPASRYWDVHDCAWKQYQHEERDSARPGEPVQVPQPREVASAVEVETPVRA